MTETPSSPNPAASTSEPASETPASNPAPSAPNPTEPAAPCQPATPAEKAGEELILGKFKSHDDLANAYKELETRQRTSREELRNEVLNEINEKSEKPPETYEVPEGLDAEAAAENEQFQGFAKYAKEQGWTQQQFNDAVSFYLASNAGPDLEAERSALGENADARIEAVSAFVSSHFTEDEFAVLEPLGATAAGVAVLEKLMGLTQTKVAQGDTSSGSAETREEMLTRAKRMQDDPRYHSQRDRDPAYVKEVTELFRKAHA